jgi:hypothetical protein
VRWRAGVLAALSILLFASPALGAELTVAREGGSITAVLRGLAFPPTLPKDLESGLTTHLLVRLTLLENGRTEEQRDIDVAVRYDLWDENFPLRETADGSVLRSQVFTTLDQVTRFLENIRLPQALPAARLLPGSTYTLSAQVLLNPIERQRMERLKQWVAENSASERAATPVSSAPLGNGPSAPPAVAPPESLFDRIFQQYASGLESSSVWRQTLVSAPFRLEDLSRDPG